MDIGDAINIKSIQANSLFTANRKYNECMENNVPDAEKKYYLDIGKAVINESLFSNHMKHHGVTVIKGNKSNDFIVLKFDYAAKIKDDSGKKTKISASKLRTYYYENGADVWYFKFAKMDKDSEERILVSKEKIHYKMLMRSPGKAKEGDCIFIRENLYEYALRYITMDLYDKMLADAAQIVEMSAYCTLATATAQAFIHIPWENIFVVKDEEVHTEIKALTVKAKDVVHTKEAHDCERNVLDCETMDNYINGLGFTFYKKIKKEKPDLQLIKRTRKALLQNGIDKYFTKKITCTIKEKKFTIKECYVDRTDEMVDVKNTLWDGMGLIDDSIFPDNMEGFIYCRSHFFKSCLFRGSVQQFFKDNCEDYENATSKDAFGNIKKLSDIKVILTENSIKWVKFVELMGGTFTKANKYYKDFMKKNKYEFEIVKTAHSSHWGNLQRASYQVNNSLPSTDEDVLEKITKVSTDYTNSLKTTHEAFIKHLKITVSKKYSINNVLVAIDEWNENFKYTKYFRDKKSDIISDFKNERLKRGKLLQEGDNLTICGNPIALLMKVVGQDFMKEGCFKRIDNGIQCYTTRFNDGEGIAAFRSPHNSPNNIVHLVNTYSEPLQKYFSNLGNNVVVINGIETDVQERLNSQDLDSDFVFATNQPDMVELAKYAYMNYPTIINGIKPDGKKYKKNMASYAEMDNKISANQNAIGRASNIAQLALSYYYDADSKSEELEDVFVMCSVLAQIAIDESKRTFGIKVSSELNRIKHFSCMKRDDGKLYPAFYADIQNAKREQNEEKIELKQIRKFNCPMEILADIIEENVIDLRGHREIIPYKCNFNTVFKYKPDRSSNNKQYKKIIRDVEEYDKEVNFYDKDAEDYSQKMTVRFNELQFKLRNVTINPRTMSTLIAYAFAEKCGIRDRLLVTLYDKAPDVFLNCFINTKKVPQESLQAPIYKELSNLPMRKEREKNVG